MSSLRAILLASVLGACLLGATTAISGAAGAQDPAPAGSGDPAPADAGLPSGVEVEREDISLRTEKSRTYETSDGRRFTKLFLRPVNAKGQDGEWRKIDTDLKSGSNSNLETTNTDFDLSLPKSLDTSAVRVADGGDVVAFSLKNAAASRAEVDGSEAHYENVQDGVDATYTAGANSVKEILTLKDASAPNAYEFALRLSDGLTPRKDRDGSISILDGDGKQTMVIPAPTIEDANGATTTDVSFDLDKAGADWTLSVKVAKDWLADDQRAYPVKLDPSLFTDPLQDCTIKSGAPSTSFCSADTTEVGNTSGSESRTNYSFDVESIIPRGARVSSAFLYTRVTGKATSVNNRNYDIWRLTKPFSSTATWNSASSGSAWTSPGGDIASNKYGNFGLNGTEVVPFDDYWYPLTKMVQEWSDGTQPNYGFQLRGTNAQNKLTMRSSESADPSQQPYLAIDWDYRPGMASQFSQSGQRLSDRTDANVNIANGNLTVRGNDLNLAGTGMSLSVGRNFNNLTPFSDSKLGPKWRTTTGGDIKLKTLESVNALFIDETGAGHLFQGDGSGTYTSPTGINATLSTVGSLRKLAFDQSKVDYYFNDAGDLVKQVDRNGNEIAYTYAAPGKLTSVKDTRGQTTAVTYNTDNQLTKVTDPSGRVYQYGYDSAGRLSTYTDPASKVTTYTYDGSGNLSQIKDPQGIVTRMEYDATGRVTELKRNYNTSNKAYTARWRYAYTTANSACASTDITKTVVTDPRGNSTTYCFDTELRATKVTDAKGRIQSSTYNPNSDVTESKNGSATSRMEFNTTNDPTGASSPAGEKATLDYDGINGSPHQPTMSTNAQGSKTQFAYSSEGNLTQTGDGASPTQISATLEYNGAAAGLCANDPNTKKGTLRCAVDGKGNKTLYSYDTQGRLLKITPPVGIGATTMTYDTAGRLKTSKDGKGQTTSYQYDNLDRKTRTDFADGSYITYSYDANGNRTSRTDSINGTTNWVYDALNRRVKDTLPVSKVTNYTYDSGSNLTSLADTTGTTSYGYDETNQLSSLTQPDGGQATFGYDSRDNLTTTNYPNGVVETRTYDLSDKPSTIKALKAGSAPLTDFTYTYDLGSKATEIQQTMKDKTGNTTTYGYDGLDRLTSAITRTSAAAVTDNRSWAYDAASNRTQETVNGSTRSFAFSPSNQPCVVAANTTNPGTCAAPASGAQTYTYDANGNRLSGNDGSLLAYNARNQTVGVKTDSSTGSVTQTFQGEGQDEQSGDGSRKLYTNALGVGLIEGDTWGRADVVRKPSGQLFSTYQYGQRRYPLQDSLGSVRVAATETAASAGEFSYDAWGKMTATGQNSQNLFYYAGGYRTTTGLAHFGARFYNANQAAWTQADPLDQPGDLKQANRYQYAADNPVNMVDPQGTLSFESILNTVEKTAKTVKRATLGNTVYCAAKAKFRADKVAPLAPLTSFGRAKASKTFNRSFVDCALEEPVKDAAELIGLSF